MAKKSKPAKANKSSIAITEALAEELLEPIPPPGNYTPGPDHYWDPEAGCIRFNW